MKFRNILGYTLLLISSLLILDQLWALAVFAFDKFGFWGGIFNFSLLPITFLAFPLLVLFVTGSSEALILTSIVVGLFYLAWRLLTEKPGKISKPKELKIGKKNLPIINAFDLIKTLFAVPFSYYLIIFSTGLTALVGLMLIGLIYYVGSLFGIIFTGVLFLLGLGVAVSIFLGLYSMIAGLRRGRVFTIAFELKDGSSPIFLMVKEVAEKLNTSAPAHILVSFSPELYVHQANSILIDGTKIRGRTLTFGYPFIKYLKPQEAKAIIAHELAHFTGRDTFFSLYAFPTYKSFQVLILNLAELFRERGGESGTNWMAIPNFLSLLILSSFYGRFAKLIAKVDRVREARADIIGAICYGTNAFRNGLNLISKLEPVFQTASQRDFWELITEHKKTFINYFAFFDKTYFKDKKLKKLMNEIAETDSITSELDTHFSLKERFSYLPDNNEVEYSKELILDKKAQEEFENRLSEMYGTFVKLVSDRLTGAPTK